MRRTAESIIVRENCSAEEGGDYALTRYRALLENDGYTLVAASPVTGRTHQLRVHFAGLRAPIVGDDMYGSASPLINRHALHSAVLTFPTVGGSEQVTVTAPPPDDMKNAIRAVFGELADINETVRLCERFLLENDKIN